MCFASALVSQKICCLQAHDGVFTRTNASIHIHACTYMYEESERCIGVSTCIPCVLSSSILWSATYLAAISKVITICASSSNVCLIVMRDRRISGYSFKNYSYFLCAFKRFGDLAIRDLSIRAIQHRYFKYRHFLTFFPKI